MARYGALVASGVTVAFVVILVAVWEFGSPRASPAYQIAGGFLALFLLIGAFLLARFVRRHSDEIGEARFDTRNKDERGG